MRASAELQVLLDPAAAYRRLASPDADPGSLFWRVLLVACTLGAAVPALAAGQITPALFAGSAICWAFVPALQVLTGLALVGTAPAVPRRRAVALLFLGHAPWSVWVLAMGALGLVVPMLGLGALAISALVPLALTLRILDAFCREVLRLPRAVARRRVLAHQALTWTMVFLYLQTASQFLPRLIGVFRQ